MYSVNDYLSEISKYFEDENSSEHSYRTSFQNYLATIFPESDETIKIMQEIDKLMPV